MLRKVQSSSKHLCTKCNFGRVTTIDDSKIISLCRYGGSEVSVKGTVTNCTQFHDKSLPSMFDFETIAWTLRTDKSGKAIGFEKPLTIVHDD